MLPILIPPENKSRSFTNNILIWGRVNYAKYPWRCTKNLWHGLVAEIMLQRTSADQVLPVYNAFCEQYESPRDYLQFTDGKVFNSLGLKWREKKLIELAEVLSEKNIPEEREQLLKLPGVGEYIASAYRSFHLGLYDVIIDSNIVRLYGRYYGFVTDGETRRNKKLYSLAEILTPEKSFKTYNYGLIDFTRAVCTPKPFCKECPLSDNCIQSGYSI